MYVFHKLKQSIEIIDLLLNAYFQIIAALYQAKEQLGSPFLRNE